MFNLGPMEMIIVMGIAVLLFGKRLPEVGRSLGKGIVEFKKGLNGVADDIDISGTGGHSSSSHGSSWRSEARPSGEPAYTDATVPKFELPGAASSTNSTNTAAGPEMEYQPGQSRD
jgi:sec-independent protein translocase protein TatA